MIYTVTLNPTLDRTMHFPQVVVGALNRASISRTDLSGKGVNVSVALRRFSLDSVMVGFRAGTYGRLLVDGLTQMGHCCDFVEVEGDTRSNITVIDDSTGITTKLNESGPMVDEADLEALERRLVNLAQSGDTCVFSGSLPPGAPLDTYARLISALQPKGVSTVLDTSGGPLTRGCMARPKLVKPNLVEAMDLVSVPFDTPRDLLKGAMAILALGPRSVLLTLGERGAVYAADGAAWLAEPPPIRELSAVGAGDASLAGALYALQEELPGEEIIRWAVASGTATATEDGSSIPAMPRIREIHGAVRVSQLGATRL